MSEYNVLALEDFARAFGTYCDDIPADIRGVVQTGDFEYRKLSQSERDQVILGVLRRLDTGDFVRVGQERHAIWEKAWSERTERFRDANYAVEGLIPNYIDANPVVRLNSDYVLPRSPGFERNFSSVLRPWLFRKYLAEADAVYEFGCGSGMNLTTLGELYPEKHLYGLDWAASAVDLVNLIGERQKLNLKAMQFDFFVPNQDLGLEPNSAVVTMCALEQIGDRHEAFIQFLLNRSPAVCLHMEPLCELYDESLLPDYLAIRYHKQRGYLDGFLTRLEQLASQLRIEIVKKQRVFFGSLYHEGYSYVVWRPLGGR